MHIAFRATQAALAAPATIAVLAALAAGPAGAQAGALSMSPAGAYLVDRWTTDHGLPANAVNGIVQTSDGYLWLGTLGGLARFDGVRFTLVPRIDSAGTHLDRIHGMKLARGDTMWLATEEGLLRYAGGEFRHWGPGTGLPARSVSSVLPMADGDVWVASQGGLLRFSAGRFELVDPATGGRLVHDAEGLVWLSWGAPGSVVFRVGPDGAVERDTRWTGALGLMLQDPDGARWLHRLHASRVYRVEAPDTAADPAGRRWSHEHGVLRPNYMVRDRSGELWLGSMGGGVRVFRPDAPGEGRAWEVVAHEMPSRGGVSRMFVDAEGTLWVGTTADGLMRIRRTLFDVAAHEQAGAVTTVLEDRAGRIWLGSTCQGVFRGDAEGRDFDPVSFAPALTATCVASLAEGDDGALWIGGYTRALARSQDGRVSFPADAAGNRLGNVMALHVAPDGTLWAGQLDRGLYAFRPDGTLIRHYGVEDGLGHPDVRFITTDSTGAAWIGTTGGFGRLRDGRFDWFTSADGLAADHVRAVRPEADGTLWIGTYGGGLARFRDGRFVAIRASDGLADDVVSAILEDDDGHFWMSGNRGIFRARRSDLEAFADGRTPRVHSVLYGKADGLLSAETNGGFQPAAWRAADGRLWFPTLLGAAVVDPARAGPHGAPPPTVVEAVLVNGTPGEVGRALEVAPGRPTLEIHYTGLSFTAPEHIVFRYRLIGYEEAWTRAGTRRVAYYPRLPPGRYRFEVEAANRDGAWGRAAALPLRVRPAVWETLWFGAALFLLAAAALAAGLQRRIAAVRRSEAARQAFSRVLLEGQEAERRRIAGELHDGLGQDLLLVKNYAALALAGPANGSSNEHFEKIAELATGALGSVRSLTRALTPRQLDHVGITEALADVLRTAEDASGVRFLVELDDVDDAFNLNAQINIFRIAQEAVSNILKHADARHVEVRLTRDPSTVRLVIADDGRGFDPRARTDGGRGLGLDGIRQRVDIMGGTLALASAPGAGTRITASLPLPLPLPEVS